MNTNLDLLGPRFFLLYLAELFEVISDCGLEGHRIVMPTTLKCASMFQSLTQHLQFNNLESALDE
jgi:hypothetical protein